MDFQVRLQKRALNDLERLVRFIARDDAEAAKSFGNALVQQAEGLSSAPARGQVYDLARGIYSIPFSPYRIYYRVRGETVEILKIWHGARGRKPWLR